MHLSIIISRLSNFLLFVFVQRRSKSDLAEFALGDYVSDENFSLSLYGENEDKIWRQIERTIGKKKARQLKADIVSFESKFILYWWKESKSLHIWEKYFQSNQLLFQRVISEIEIMCGVEHFAVVNAPIYLVSNSKLSGSEVQAWFSWEPEKSFVVVEIPDGFGVVDSLFPIAVLAHEFFHLILRENKDLLVVIDKFAAENEESIGKSSGGTSSKMFLEELLISSFIPEGYLNEKHLGGKVTTCTSKPKDLLDWRKLISFKLRSVAKRYIDNTRQIDKKYLEYIIGVVEQNVK